MKNHISQLDMLEKQFMEDINTSVLNLLSIKYSQKVSEIAKCQISHIIQNRIDETIWINELKDNLNKLIIEYGSQLQEEKKQLNIRMDFLEQRMLDMLRRMDSL
jgi:hypothetical protein